MSHSSKIFEEAPIKVPNKNGFDLSHLNVGTSKVGQLVPVMCKLLPPNSDFTLGVNLEVNLPPLATSCYGRIDAIVEGFVVPCSILYGGWKQFISNNQSTMFPASQSVVAASGFQLPRFDLTHFYLDDSTFQSDFGKNDNLTEYLGFMGNPDFGEDATGVLYLNLLPFLAYHLIWDVYYRNKQITKTIFSVNPNATSSGFNDKNVSLIWHSFYSSQSATYSPVFSTIASLRFPDGVPVWRTRQRNYARDYFTAATPSPQQGSASQLRFEVEDSEGAFTIASLRAANALQKFLETNNLSGDYADMMRNRWGTRPIDADFDEPYYLGRVVIPVYQKTVYQQDSSAKANAVNPFAAAGAIGAKGAAGGFVGKGSIVDKFHNSTWAYVMCLFSLVPHAMYGLGLNRELTMLQLGDFPAPELQSVGNEPIFEFEIYPTGSDETPASADLDEISTFGYIPRYSFFKYMLDEVHGEMRPGKTLDSFVLQRDFSSAPSLSSAFLEIPQTALDSVLAVSTSAMNLSCWYEIFFEFKVAMPLADFCIPTLGDIKDTHTQKIKIGGSRL